MPNALLLPRSAEIQTPDGVAIAVREWGDPEGQPLLFIHGYAQSGLCWERQVTDPALAHLRLVTYDLRGHGGSEKPLDARFYGESRRWAEEVRAIAEHCRLVRPVLVGWSYGGRIICDYLASFGALELAGIVFVDAVTATEKHFFGSCNALMRQMTQDDPATCIAATRAFLRACFYAQPDPDLFETLLAAAMMAPPKVRAAMARPADYGELLTSLNIPALVIQGCEDRVITRAMAEHIAGSIGGARLEVMEAGHAPFLECPAAFNAALLRFVNAAT